MSKNYHDEKELKRVGTGHASIVHVHSRLFFLISKVKKEIQVMVNFKKQFF
jgi:hypothetical protein